VAIINDRMRVPVHGAVIGQEEKSALLEVVQREWYTAGSKCNEFEHKLQRFTGRRFAIMVNSGSSANLIAAYAIADEEWGYNALHPEDEFITCAVGFPTTLNPFLMLGCRPVFVDCSLPQLNPILHQIEDAITPRTRAIVLAHTLGMPLPEGLRELCDKFGLWFIEDCCDALGSPRTFIGDISTLSFYPAHQITTGEGGAVITDNPKLAKIARSLRDWGRDCWCEGGKDDTCGRRFERDYDHKYTYSRLGFHLAPTEFQGAIGTAQMGRINDFVSARDFNHAYLNRAMIAAGMEEYFILPPNVSASWFGYALICKEMIDRNAITRWLETRGIQTRLIFGGNLTRQPAYQRYFGVEMLPNADAVHRRAFWVGCWPGLNIEQLDWIVYSMVEYTKGLK
jgi:CDP-4-dehydro-6-deoxyglucose reductase, E1